MSSHRCGCPVSSAIARFVALCAVRYVGYGFYRPQMTLFDPGWRGEQTKGPEDWGVADLGNDPMGIIDRYVLMWLSRSDVCSNVHAINGCSGCGSGSAGQPA